MTFRIVTHTPRASNIRLDKKQQYWILEQEGIESRAIAFAMTEQDAKWLLELVNYGVTFLVSHGRPA